MSSFYDVSSMGGMIMASGLVTLFCMRGWVEEKWRLLFWMGSITAIFGLFLRLKTQEGKEFFSRGDQRRTWQSFLKYRKDFIAIIIASGFSYATYSMSFTLMNGYIPLVTSLKQTDMMGIHTGLLIMDMCLLPCFGLLAQRFGKEKIMFIGAMSCALTTIPLFVCLKGASLLTATLVRSMIMIFGVAFAAPFHAYKLQRIPPQHRYTLLSLGCVLGSQLIGAPTSSICLWLYQKMGFVWAPGLYLVITGALAASVVYVPSKYPSPRDA
jgi:Na+/melibiose symporter-like transporter